ncbi:MAG: Rne/Rng family ribonuclease [Planctomycetota bacterium]
MKKVMLINVLQPEECRIAILENGILEELYVERNTHESYVGNIYKGKIVNIEPSIQAAFVDFGIGRNGFLHVSDVEPTYYKHLDGYKDENEEDEREDRRPRRDRSSNDRSSNDRSSNDRSPNDRSPNDRSPNGGGSNRGPRSRPFENGNIPDVENLPPEQNHPIANVPEFSSEIFEEQDDLAFENKGDFLEHDSDSSISSNSDDSVTFGAGLDDDAPEDDFGPDDNDTPPVMPSANRITSDGDEESNGPDETESDDLLFSRPARSNPPAHESSRDNSDSFNEPVFDQAQQSFPSNDNFDDDVQDSTQDSDQTFDSNDNSEQDDENLDEDGQDSAQGRDNRGQPDSRGPQRDSRGGDNRNRGGRGGNQRRPSGGGGYSSGSREGARDQGRSSGKPMRGNNSRGGRLLGKPKPMIQEIFKKGQEVLVQVIKDGIGNKGPTLSTYISIAGRYLVLMPGLNRVGVSRKIIDEDQRRRLKDIFVDLKPPKGVGFIIRTAGIDRNKTELQRDLAYLARLWQVVAKRIVKVKGPAGIYEESDMVTRTIRDTFTSDIDEIVVDEKTAFEHAQEFLQFVMPRFANRVKFHDNKRPLFHHYAIEEEIAKIQMKKIPLPMGGSIVIEQTEALVAIDVNSGNFRSESNAEDTAFRMNMQAAREITRQLRLRDLGGVIVNDFIDMRDEKHRRAVENAMRDNVMRDRAKTKILRISPFGIIEMTRQRIRPSLKRSVYHDCPYCKGMAQVKTSESMGIEVMRLVQLAAFKEAVATVRVRVASETADYLLNNKRKELGKLEDEARVGISVRGEMGVPPELLEVFCVDANGNELKIHPLPEPPQVRRGGGRFSPSNSDRGPQGEAPFRRGRTSRDR